MEYRIARLDEEREILDFSNMVFAMAPGPIDFKEMYPAIYGRKGFSNLHIIAKDVNNRLVSSIAVKPIKLRLGKEESLSAGYLGTVATHPQERGKGYMKQLMQMSVERAKNEAMDLLILGGQRQRYNHYGFERCAPVLTFCLQVENLRELPAKETLDFVPLKDADVKQMDAIYDAYCALDMLAERKREDFTDIMRTENGQCYMLMSRGNVRGYVYAQGNHIYEYASIGGPKWEELVCSWQHFKGCKSFNIVVPTHQKKAVAVLGAVSESWSLHDTMMVRVLRWQTVLQKLMSFKARFQQMNDGEAVVEVNGEAKLRLYVKNNEPHVDELSMHSKDYPRIIMTPQQAIRRFLSPIGVLQESEDSLYGWFPLMLSIPKTDWF